MPGDLAIKKKTSWLWDWLSSGRGAWTDCGVSCTRDFQNPRGCISNFEVGPMLQSGLDGLQMTFQPTFFCDSVILSVYATSSVISWKNTNHIYSTWLQAIPPVRSQTSLLCFFGQKLHILFPSRKIISWSVVCCPDWFSNKKPHCFHVVLSKNKKSQAISDLFSVANPEINVLICIYAAIPESISRWTENFMCPRTL